MLTQTERSRLLRIAGTLEAEAQTWREGFAVHEGGTQWSWTKEYEWVQLRVLKLESARDFLRVLAKKGQRMDKTFVKKQAMKL